MNERLQIFALLGGCMLLGAIVFFELDPGPAAEKTAIAAPDPPAAVLAIHPQPSGRFAKLVRAILARPLFSPTRRPAAADDKRDGAGSDLAGMRLTGIITLPSLRIAIFAVKGRRPIAVGEGDTVGGWRIEKITPATVALRGPGGLRELAPKSDGALPHTPLPGAFAAPAGEERAGFRAIPGRGRRPPFRFPAPPAARAQPWR